MGTSELKNLISESVASADIELLEYIAEAIDTYKANGTSSSLLTKEQMDELDKRRARYRSGRGTSYSWEEVKKQLKENHGFSS